MIFDNDEQNELVPTGKPEEVYLAKLPEMNANKDGQLSVDFTYRAAKDGAEGVFKIFDPFNMKEDLDAKLKAANVRKALAIYGVMMTKEKFEDFKKIDHKDFEGYHKKAISYFKENSLNTKLELLFGYDNKTGFLTLPTFGNFISSPDRPRNLVFDPNLLSLVKVKRKGNKPDADEEDDNDEGI